MGKRVLRTEQMAAVTEAIEEGQEDACALPKLEQLDLTKAVSTGSTLLDLAISGDIMPGGGIPGGVIAEIYGPSGAGKTAILSELSGNAYNKGGDINFLDPEARLNKEYARIYGMELNVENYSRPGKVDELFDELDRWVPKPVTEGAISVCAADSLAAFTTQMELDGDDGMGMRRAKEFSAGLRKYCRIVPERNIILACSNQERESQNGIYTPGGKGIPYYSSLRIRIAPSFKPTWKLTRTRTVRGVSHEKQVGIRSLCRVVKSTIDAPFREAPVFIVFGYGVHDIWGNLQWYKEATKGTKYLAVDKEFSQIEYAIKHVEQNDLEAELRAQVSALWQEIQQAFATEYKPKARW